MIKVFVDHSNPHEFLSEPVFTFERKIQMHDYFVYQSSENN